MKTQRRWMRWVFKEVETFNTRMPWERGYGRRDWKKPQAVTVPATRRPRLLANG